MNGLAELENKNREKQNINASIRRIFRYNKINDFGSRP